MRATSAPDERALGQNAVNAGGNALVIFGPHALATMACVFSVAMFVVILGGSLGMATEILVGRKVGAGDMDAAYHLPLRSVRRGLAAVCVAAVPMAFSGPIVLRWLNPDPAVFYGGSALLLLGLALEPGRVFNLVVGSALRATGDSRVPFLLTSLSMWGLWIPLSWLLGLRLGLGLPGFWLAMIADEWVRGVVLYLRGPSARFPIRSRTMTARLRPLAFTGSIAELPKPSASAALVSSPVLPVTGSRGPHVSPFLTWRSAHEDILDLALHAKSGLAVRARAGAPRAGGARPDAPHRAAGGGPARRRLERRQLPGGPQR